MKTYTSSGDTKVLVGSTAIDTYGLSDQSRTSTSVAIDGYFVANLIAGATYEFWVSSTVTTTASSQLKYDWGGTCTATSFTAWAWVINAAITVQTWDIKTALGGTGTVMPCTNGANIFFAKGNIVCNAAGTFGLTWASDNAAAVVLNRDAYMMIKRLA
jgi:hypothetical protein